MASISRCALTRASVSLLDEIVEEVILAVIECCLWWPKL
jgi:hypothetical protein